MAANLKAIQPWSPGQAASDPKLLALQPSTELSILNNFSEKENQFSQ